MILQHPLSQWGHKKAPFVCDLTPKRVPWVPAAKALTYITLHHTLKFPAQPAGGLVQCCMTGRDGQHLQAKTALVESTAVRGGGHKSESPFRPSELAKHCGVFRGLGPRFSGASAPTAAAGCWAAALRARGN